MLDDSVAVRYAETLFQVALEKDKTEQWKNQLENFVQSVKGSQFLSNMLPYPLISVKDKKNMLKKVFSSKLDVQIMNFIYVILDNHRVQYINLIYDKYIQCIRDAAGIITAEVTTATVLSASEKAKLRNAISAREGCSVDVEFKTNPSLLGGAIVKSGGKIIDGSLQKTLRDIKNRLTNAGISSRENCAQDDIEK